MNSIQISGGIDSMAMLWLLRDIWDNSVVMWCDTHAAYPETRRVMEEVRAMVPHFRVVHGDQPAAVEKGGIPVDVVPVRYSWQGEVVAGPQLTRYQSFFDCCRQSIWEPMQRACLAMGVDVIYRGQRQQEEFKSPLTPGYRDSYGILYQFPLFDWSREQVFNYARQHCPGLIPEYYSQGEVSSRDCWSCTAYLRHNGQRIKALPAEQRTVVEQRIARWREHVNLEMEAKDHG